MDNYIKEFFKTHKNKSIDELNNRIIAIKEELENPDADAEKLKAELLAIEKVKDSQEEERNRAFKSTEYRGKKMNKNIKDSIEYRNAFFKTLKGVALNQEERAAFERVNMETRNGMGSDYNSAVIPTQTLNEVIKRAKKEGGLFARCRAFNIPSNLAIPVAAPTEIAKWHVEGEEEEASNSKPTKVVFKSNEIMKIFSISATVKEMTINAFEKYLVEELTRSVFGCLENAVIKGTGSNQGQGLETVDFKKNGNLVEVKELDYSSIMLLIAKLKKGYAKGSIFACNNVTLYSKIYGMTDSTGRPLFDPEKNRLAGYEIIVDDNIDDNIVYFGNFNYLGYNLPGGIKVDSSTQSSFKKGVIDYRALAIADTKIILEEAFCKLEVKGNEK